MFGADAYWLDHHFFSCPWGLVGLGVSFVVSGSVIPAVWLLLG